MIRWHHLNDRLAWREAFEELSRRKLRTGLTLLGLVFGVGSIVAMQAVGEGSRREALRLVEGLGLTNLVVEAKTFDETTLRELRADDARQVCASLKRRLAKIDACQSQTAIAANQAGL